MKFQWLESFSWKKKFLKIARGNQKLISHPRNLMVGTTVNLGRKHPNYTASWILSLFVVVVLRESLRCWESKTITNWTVLTLSGIELLDCVRPRGLLLTGFLEVFLKTYLFANDESSNFFNSLTKLWPIERACPDSSFLGGKWKSSGKN